MAYRGDLISCTVEFELAKDGKVPIVFYLNGRQITEDKILMEYTQNGKLYPYIGMGHTGLRVLAKVSLFTSFSRCHMNNDDNLTPFVSSLFFFYIWFSDPRLIFKPNYYMLAGLQCRCILGQRNLVRVLIVVAAIFDLMTVEVWGE